MFERYTDRSRRILVLAQESARVLNHNYLGTEHILLGLIHEGEGLGALTMKSLGVDLDAARKEVEEIIGQGQQAPSGRIPFTPRAKKVLELALREALQLGHNYIGSEHLLLGLIREGEGVGCQVLVKLGLDLNKVRQQVLQLLGDNQACAEAETVQETVERGAMTLEQIRKLQGYGQSSSQSSRLLNLCRWVGHPVNNLVLRGYDFTTSEQNDGELVETLVIRWGKS